MKMIWIPCHLVNLISNDENIFLRRFLISITSVLREAAWHHNITTVAEWRHVPSWSRWPARHGLHRTGAQCHVPRDHVSHRRSLEPRHHHPRLRQRRLLRLPHHHPDPLPLLPEVISDDDDCDDDDDVGAGGAAGTRTTSPTAPSSTTSSRTQSASAPVWRSTSRWCRVTCHVSHVQCHVSRVTCHVSRVRTSSVTRTWPGCWGRASPRSSVRTAWRWSCPPRASSSSPTHGSYVTKYFSCVYINILFLFQDTWIWCAEASVSCLPCVTRRYRWHGRENIDLTNIIIILIFSQQIVSRILILSSVRLSQQMKSTPLKWRWYKMIEIFWDADTTFNL